MSQQLDAIENDGRDETPNQRADRNWGDLLQEARVTQTSTQILGGFLLAIAFQPRFTELDSTQEILYLVLVALAGLSTALSLALVMIHRRYFAKLEKQRVVTTGSRLLNVNLTVVAILGSGVTGFVFDLVIDERAGVIAFVVSLALIVGLWAGLPLSRKTDPPQSVTNLRN